MFGVSSRAILRSRTAASASGVSTVFRAFSTAPVTAWSVRSFSHLRTFALVRVDPAGGHGNQFLVQTSGRRAVQPQPAQQYDTRDGIGCLCQAGPRQIVVNEPLSDEPSQQALYD